MDTILQQPQWPAALSDFVTWCLVWDPRNRPTSFQAMNHEYFHDAVDPLLLRPKSSSRLMGRRSQPTTADSKPKDAVEPPAFPSRASWFRKSFVGRENNQAPYQPTNPQNLASPRPSPVHQVNSQPTGPVSPLPRPNAAKRTTWTNGPTSVAPMPILPSIRPISPLSNAVTAEARSTNRAHADKVPAAGAADVPTSEKKKIGRQLSVASHGNHYGDREGGMSGLASPTNGQKESFFSHLRKRARRFSGRNHIVASPRHDDVDADQGSNARRSSIMAEPVPVEPPVRDDFTELDRALQNVRYSLDTSSQPHLPLQQAPTQRSASVVSLVHPPNGNRAPAPGAAFVPAPDMTITPGMVRSTSRTRRGLQLSAQPHFQYETPNEEEELLDEALHGVSRAMRRMDGNGHGGSKRRLATLEPEVPQHRTVLVNKDINRPPVVPMQQPTLHHSVSTGAIHHPYPTPSPSAKRSGQIYSHALLDEPATPININRPRKENNHHPGWPTPPYEENEWAASAAAQILAAGSAYR